MYDKDAEQAAAHFGILDRMQALESDLLKIEGISDIEFCIADYRELHQIVIVPRYKPFPCDKKYFARRQAQVQAILTVCIIHDLRESGDRIEDYGEHWYIVRDCGETWPR